MSEKVFVHEWDIDAPIDAVFDAIADARTWPEWMHTHYQSVVAEGQPKVGWRAEQNISAPGSFDGVAKQITEIVRYERPNLVEFHFDTPQFAGSSIWKLSQTDGGKVHLAREVHMHPTSFLGRIMQPFTAPAGRLYVDYIAKEAQKGLEPYVRRKISAR